MFTETMNRINEESYCFYKTDIEHIHYIESEVRNSSKSVIEASDEHNKHDTYSKFHKIYV